jgi:DNA-binding transcriptional LysR family regulator
MSNPDLNLLTTLDALLSEGSVAGAARRLRLSPSAMSRALTRLRETLGDPLLVRAGRGLVPTPRATALREQVSVLLQEVQGVLRPAEQLKLAQLERSFTLRVSDGFTENFGAQLVKQVQREAPAVRLRFVQKLDKDSSGLRLGTVDLETGVIANTTGPEVRVRTLFRDRFVGVVRLGHPLCKGVITTARYAAGQHTLVSRRGLDRGLMDELLAAQGLSREIVTFVSGFSDALGCVRGSNLIATLPERHTGNLRAGLFSFALPFPTPEITVSMMWHPRMDGDAAHRWLRDCMLLACAAPASPTA